jgi:hypothetical protein
VGIKGELQAQLAETNRQLALINRVGNDNFSIGTIAVFDAPNTNKWYYAKVAEELWENLKGGEQKSLADWIFKAEESAIGYFEVYEMNPKPQPFYTGAESS